MLASDGVSARLLKCIGLPSCNNAHPMPSFDASAVTMTGFVYILKLQCCDVCNSILIALKAVV